jgi:hypothetical protein
VKPTAPLISSAILAVKLLLMAVLILTYYSFMQSQFAFEPIDEHIFFRDALSLASEDNPKTVSNLVVKVPELLDFECATERGHSLEKNCSRLIHILKEKRHLLRLACSETSSCLELSLQSASILLPYTLDIKKFSADIHGMTFLKLASLYSAQETIHENEG